MENVISESLTVISVLMSRLHSHPGCPKGERGAVRQAEADFGPHVGFNCRTWVYVQSIRMPLWVVFPMLANSHSLQPWLGKIVSSLKPYIFAD